MLFELFYFMDFRTLGFQTGKVVLPGLELEVELGPNQFFRNDGVVDNLAEHDRQIVRELGLITFLEKDSIYASSNFKGTHWPIAIGLAKGSLIYVTDVGEAIPFCFGHESTHAICHLNLKDPFLKLLSSEGFSLNPFEKYSDPEDIADIGGCLAFELRRRDYMLVSNSRRNNLYSDLLASRK